MTTENFIIELFCRIDDRMKPVPKHSQAHLWHSEVVTIGVLFGLKGVGERGFYRWLRWDYHPLFPHLPERARASVSSAANASELDLSLFGSFHAVGGDRYLWD